MTMYISATEAARRLGVSRGTVHHMVRTGRLRPVQLVPGGRRWIPAGDLERLTAVLRAEAEAEQER
jgi:excisionase family DNA binding protein